MFSVSKDNTLYKPGRNPETYINKIQEILYDDVFSTYSEDPRLLHIVAQLIGEDITALNCMLINKPPGTGEHPAHQDLLYFSRRPVHKMLASWTAIDPVSKDNGCLYVIPGSHKLGELYEHIPETGRKFFYHLSRPDLFAPVEKRVYLEMKPGDTVFFSSTLVHGSRPNITQMYRKCISCHYANSDCNYVDVTGTIQEEFAKETEAELRVRGSDLSFLDLWRVKSKQVRGAKSHL